MCFSKLLLGTDCIARSLKAGSYLGKKQEGIVCSISKDHVNLGSNLQAPKREEKREGR
jgi:hypothetical protein